MGRKPGHCPTCWRFTEKEAASVTQGTREAFIKEMSSELTWKASQADLSQENRTGNCMCKMHLAGSGTGSDSVWWEHRVDRDGAERGRLG